MSTSLLLIVVAVFGPLLLANCQQWSSSTCQSLTSSSSYSREENSDGSLKATDDFAVNSVCYHNRFREEAAGLGGVKWNSALASFATKWSKHLKTTKDCKMEHSTNSDRQNIDGYSGYAGENLYWFWTSGSVSESSMPSQGKKAAEAWYSEMKYYQYGGANAGYNKCEMRNKDGREQVGHLTQLLWESTNEIGCDYAVCGGSGSSVLVTCVYGPGGNMWGSPAFNDKAWCKLNNWPENKDKYGGLPRCDGQNPDCGGSSDGTTSPATSAPVASSTPAQTTAAPATAQPVSGDTTAPQTQETECPTSWDSCVFPYTDDFYGTFHSCQEAYDDESSYGIPWCKNSEGYWDYCKISDSNPTCEFQARCDNVDGGKCKFPIDMGCQTVYNCAEANNKWGEPWCIDESSGNWSKCSPNQSHGVCQF